MAQRFYAFLIILLPFLVVPQSVLAQVESHNVEGSWMGTLKAGVVELRIVFNITVADDGSISATMDSPDQGVTGISMGSVLIWEDSIKIDAPIANGFYIGKRTSPTEIKGIWSQSNQKFTLDIEIQSSEFKLNRPQEPKPPYPYIEEEVTFINNSAGITLAGTITRPKGDKVYPAVILVTGSGPQNRDEEIFGHKPFKYLADQLTRAGIVVLRYDDRGAGSSEGTPLDMTTEDFSTDALSALLFVESKPYVDKSATGIIGHSEGGLIAIILAAKHKEIDFIVTLAGPGTDGATIMHDQSEYISRQSGVADSIINLNSFLNSNIYRIISEYQDPAEGLNSVEKFVTVSMAERGVESDIISQIVTNLKNSLGGGNYNWMRYFISCDPADYLSEIECPVLVLNGALDCQVLAEKNIRAIREGLEMGGNKVFRTEIFPGLNHLFQSSKSGLVDEYGVIEETMSPVVPETIIEWVLTTFR